MSRDLEAEGKNRREDALLLLAMFDAAAQRILGDPAVWVEESCRVDPEPLPWPLQARGEGWAQLLRIFAAAVVDNILHAIGQAHGAQWVPPQDPADDGFQLVLRVARRATDAGASALRAHFGGQGRMSIKRELVKLFREQVAEAASNSGMSRRQAFAAAGLGKTAAYDALRRRKG